MRCVTSVLYIGDNLVFVAIELDPWRGAFGASEWQALCLAPGQGPNMARTSWLIVIFDTAGEVSFAGISMLANPAFGLVLNIHYTYFRLRQQYHFW
jgi:hypothetical protein